MVVDFPEPFGPRKPNSVPAATCKFKSRTAVRRSNVLVTPRASMPEMNGRLGMMCQNQRKQVHQPSLTARFEQLLRLLRAHLPESTLSTTGDAEASQNTEKGELAKTADKPL